MVEIAKPLRPGANVAELTVSELSGAIKKTLETSYGHVRLRGEISGYRGPHSSGHCYFTLKDDKSKIDAVVWRGVFSALRFKPQEGLEVIATGKVSSFPGSSKYQIVIEALEPAGIGALMALLEERKKKLGAEGLFDDERKRKLPFLPRVVGIVTSPTGAVIRDMMHGFTERFPTRVLVWPVRVQGETSAAEVAAAIRGFNALPIDGPIPRPDVLIVARGGGSLEDLWGFNEEIVVRAAAESTIPLISAVGHETDWTLIDLAADARAPTPTKAAEWAVPKYSELIEQTTRYGERLRIGLRRGLRSTPLRTPRCCPRSAPLARSRRAAASTLRYRRQSPHTRTRRQFVCASPPSRPHRATPANAPALPTASKPPANASTSSLNAAAQPCPHSGQRRNRMERTSARLTPHLILTRIERWRAVLDTQSKLLASLSYQSVLSRGFALVRDANGNAIRHAVAVSPAWPSTSNLPMAASQPKPKAPPTPPHPEIPANATTHSRLRQHAARPRVNPPAIPADQAIKAHCSEPCFLASAHNRKFLPSRINASALCSPAHLWGGAGVGVYKPKQTVYLIAAARHETENTQ